MTIIKDALKEALDSMSLLSRYKILESPSFDLFPLTILDPNKLENTLEPIGTYYNLFSETSELIDTKTIFELSYIKNEARNINLNATVSFLDGFLKMTKLGKAEIRAVFRNSSDFDINLSKVVAMAVGKSKLIQFLSNKKVNKNSNVVERILDNKDKCAYLVCDVLLINEFSLTGKTSRGVTIEPDVKVLTDLFKKPSSETNINDKAGKSEIKNEFLSLNGKVEWSIDNKTTLTMKFPEGLVVGVAPVYFRISNEKVTFDVDTLTRDKWMADFKSSLIKSDELSILPV
jgi:hypothetical protein